MLEGKKAMVRRTTEEFWNRGNLAVIDERFADDYVGHSFAKIEGPEGVKEFVNK